jgi:hypothetical protein
MSKSAGKKVLMKMDERLARDIEGISKELEVSAETLVASLVWLGKRAMGRKVKIEGVDEKKTLTISSFEHFQKICPLDETPDGSETK